MTKLQMRTMLIKTKLILKIKMCAFIKTLHTIEFSLTVNSDIITPVDMSSNAKLPVIFWMHGGGYIAVISSIKTHY